MNELISYEEQFDETQEQQKHEKEQVNNKKQLNYEKIQKNDEHYKLNQYKVPKSKNYYGQNQNGQQTNSEDAQKTIDHINKYFDPLPTEYIDQLFQNKQQTLFNNIPIYMNMDEEHNHIIIAVHGAGDSSQTYGAISQEIKQFANLICFDFYGHGKNTQIDVCQNQKMDLNYQKVFSIQSLYYQIFEVLLYTVTLFPEKSVLLMGHSMGGCAVIKLVKFLQNNQYKDFQKQTPIFLNEIQLNEQMYLKIQENIRGIIIIDAIEGVAKQSFTQMTSIIEQRPQKFKSLNSLVKWSFEKGIIRNKNSSKMSMPSKVYCQKNQENQEIFVWKNDLMQSKQYWNQWYDGLSKEFIEIKNIQKVLITNAFEKLDNELMIGLRKCQFKVNAIDNSGHYIQEDNPYLCAYEIFSFICHNKIPGDIEEIKKQQECKIHEFHPKIKQYKRPLKIPFF